MKALTLKPPWAYAIAHLGKRVENRSWQPPASVLGQTIAIHSGRRPKRTTSAGGEIERTLHDLKRRGLCPADVTFADATVEGVVAVARIAYVSTTTRDPWFDGSGYGWMLDDVRPLPKSIFCVGALGLWTVPADTLVAIRDQLRMKP